MSWQPIETAPKDGSSILLWYEFERGGGMHFIARWYLSDDGEDRWIDPTDCDPIGNGCTHWMPLPEPPPPPRSIVMEGNIMYLAENVPEKT